MAGFYGILQCLAMGKLSPEFFTELYTNFDGSIAALDCGERCAPYNENGVPFCCDIRHAVPTAYEEEWDFLRHSTDLWHPWQGKDECETEELNQQVPDGQLLIACRGYAFCQRGFRTLACRAFPFFPYITRQGEFIGLSYHWEYEDRCWVISNLQVVSPIFLSQFIHAYEALFEIRPYEKEIQRLYSGVMRQVFGRRHRSVTLLHRNGVWYKVTPRNGRLRRVSPERLPKFGDYRLAAELPFADEQDDLLNANLKNSRR
jgi:hypothetical protein